jgi:hypothetical protein
MKQYISRNGSECIIRDSKGKLWLTVRKKIKHTYRRQKPSRAELLSIFQLKE